MLRRLFLLVGPALLCLFSASLLAQDVEILGVVVTPEKEPLPGVSVLLHELSKGTQTNEKGEFEFKKVKSGKYHLHLQLLGYHALDKDIHVGTAPLRLEFVMVPAALELRNIIIEESILKTARREQSQTLAVMDKAAMLKNGNASLVRMLESIPGINSINTGMGVSKPVIRGLGFNRVVVAENGIKQEGQQWGGDHGLEIDQFAVERVEVLKGPASLMYGSDGIGGVVSIRPAPAPARNTVEGAWLGTARSVNDFEANSVAVGVNRNDNFFRIRLSTQDYADYRIPADSFLYNTYILPLVNRRLKNTAGRERNVQMMAGITRKWGTSSITVSRFDQSVGLFSGAHGIPRSYQLIDDGDVRNIDLPRQRVIHNKIISNTSVLLGKHWMEIDLGFQDNYRREFSFPHAHGVGPTPSGNLELEFSLRTYSSNIRYHLKESNRAAWVLGAQGTFQENQIGGFSFLIPNFGTRTAGLFAFRKHELNEQFIWNAGIRFDYGNVRTERFMRAVYADSVTILGYVQASPELNRFFRTLSGSAGLSWLPSERWNIKLNLGSGYRMPTAPELTANGVHHGSFRHEQGDSLLGIERGLQTDLALNYTNKRWEFSVSPFLNYFRDFIFLDPQPFFSPLPDAGLIYRFNQADALHVGAELQTDLHLTDALHLAFNAQFVQGTNLETWYPLPFTPPAQARLEAEYTWARKDKRLTEVFAGVQLHGAAAQNRVARNEPATPAFGLVHLSAGSFVRIGKTKLQCILNIQNVLNSRYYAHLNRYRMLNLPEAGRNVMVTIVVPFQKHLKGGETK